MVKKLKKWLLHNQGSTGIPVLIPYPGIPSLFIPIPPGLNSKSRIFRDFTEISKYPIYILYIQYCKTSIHHATNNCQIFKIAKKLVYELISAANTEQFVQTAN